MRTPPGAVIADDVEAVVDLAVTALVERLGVDWHVLAGPLDRDCWETIEHISDTGVLPRHPVGARAGVDPQR